MAKKPEPRLQQRFQRALKKAFGKDIWFFKVHGGPFQKSGIPDLVGCVFGLFFAFEVKLPNDKRSESSDLQDETVADIKRAGGVTRVIEDPNEAVAILRKALARAGRGSRLRIAA